MNKKIIFVIFGGLIVVLGLLTVRARRKNEIINPVDNQTGQVSGAILFYGSTCPHCQAVEEWLKENPTVREKSGLIDKEVYENEENAKELAKKATECKIGNEGGIGVPFLYDKGKCLMGDQPIINYLKENYQ